MSTLDVIFPSAPQPLAFGAGELLQALLEPQVWLGRTGVGGGGVFNAHQTPPHTRTLTPHPVA